MRLNMLPEFQAIASMTTRERRAFGEALDLIFAELRKRKETPKTLAAAVIERARKVHQRRNG